MDFVKTFLAKDSVKIALFFLSLICGGLVLQFPPPNVIGVTAGTVVAILAGLGITSGGTSSLRSDQSNANTAALQNKGVLPPT